MRALAWNCQGMGKSLGSEKMAHLARMIYSAKPQVTFVSEIKSSKIKSTDLNARFNMYNSFVVPSQRHSGGLWLMWSGDLLVTVQKSSFYIILATVVNSTSNLKFGLVCIYGYPYHHQTSQIWDEVATFVHDNSSIPMLCMGDMNEFLYDMDKNSPNIKRNRMYAFRALVKNCGLFDLGFSGPAYT
jgi:exonuclease III